MQRTVADPRLILDQCHVSHQGTTVSHPEPEETAPGQESVWDYPRPPAIEPEDREIIVEVGGLELARTTGAYRILETSHPPVYYLPPDDIDMSRLSVNGATSFCEFKGRAEYLDVELDGGRITKAAWRYPSPTGTYEPIAGYLAFYAHKMDRCTVGDDVARPQPGNFYGGWITPDVAGPFKGEPGSMGW
jgi:uncharacterized protein (DUF427 family)